MEEAGRLQKFFCETLKPEDWDKVFETDGTILDKKALHPTAIIATNAQASLIRKDENALRCIRKFWETPLRSGNRRYYDNCLYFFAFLALSGNYKIY